MWPISSRKSVPPSATSKSPFLVDGGAGEGPFDVSKEFAFEQVFVECTAIDGDESPALAGAIEVDGTRHQLFARTALAANEHGDVAGR